MTYGEIKTSIIEVCEQKTPIWKDTEEILGLHGRWNEVTGKFGFAKAWMLPIDSASTGHRKGSKRVPPAPSGCPINLNLPPFNERQNATKKSELGFG